MQRGLRGDSIDRWLDQCHLDGGLPNGVLILGVYLPAEEGEERGREGGGEEVRGEVPQYPLPDFWRHGSDWAIRDTLVKELVVQLEQTSDIIYETLTPPLPLHQGLRLVPLIICPRALLFPLPLLIPPANNPPAPTNSPC